VLHTLAIMGTLQLGPRDVYMPITPMFHVHAWGLPYAVTALGLKQVYPGRYLPDVLVDLVVREKVTFSHCVPTILQMILASPAAQGRDFGGWRMIIGGSALPRALCQAALERGIDVFGGFGMSETCPVLSCARLQPELGGDRDSEVHYRVKAGLPIPLVDLRIVDAEMRDVPHDGVASGEVVVRAPWLTPGYLKDERASEALWRGGWLHTQDIGTIDPHGYLLITDRTKDVIKTGGEWVSSLQLEDLIGQHPGVAEVAVIGVPDAKWGERPRAVVVPRKGTAIDAAALRAHLAVFVERGEISKLRRARGARGGREPGQDERRQARQEGAAPEARRSAVAPRYWTFAPRRRLEPRRRRLRGQDARDARGVDRAGARRDPELLVGVLEVPLHGVEADAQRRRDLLVGPAFLDQPEDLELAHVERLDERGRRRGGRGGRLE
jgi:acyl-CoA synthetase (AMP-forming)/AMP-acid ligase II